jgi:phage gpG-like protein
LLALSECLQIHAGLFLQSAPISSFRPSATLNKNNRLTGSVGRASLPARPRSGFDRMLRLTNRLYQSISYNVLPDGVEWGSNVVYARIHQLGGVIDMPARRGSVTLKRIRQKGGGIRSRFARTGAKGGELREVSIRGHQVRIPARPFLGISAFDREEVTEIIADHIRQETSR